MSASLLGRLSIPLLPVISQAWQLPLVFSSREMAWKLSQYKLSDFFPPALADESGKVHNFQSASIFPQGYVLGKYTKHQYVLSEQWWLLF